MTQQDPSSAPLFETLSASRRLFYYFRFIASSFVTALSSYVYDVAIGGNFDAFLNSLASPLERGSNSTLPVFSDVFALADHHSKVMDDILSTCLLRSNQKAVGDLLRGALQIILEFGILMSDLRGGRMQEYEAAAPLEDLFSAYRRKMVNLVRRSALSLSYLLLTAVRAAQGSEGADRQIRLADRVDVARKPRRSCNVRFAPGSGSESARPPHPHQHTRVLAEPAIKNTRHNARPM